MGLGYYRTRRNGPRDFDPWAWGPGALWSGLLICNVAPLPAHYPDEPKKVGGPHVARGGGRTIVAQSRPRISFFYAGR